MPDIDNIHRLNYPMPQETSAEHVAKDEKHANQYICLKSRCHSALRRAGTRAYPNQLLLDYVYGDGLVGSLPYDNVPFFQCSFLPVLHHAHQPAFAEMDAMGIDARRAPRHLHHAVYGKCCRIARPRASAYPNDRPRFLV